MNVALIQMGLKNHDVGADMRPDDWILLWGAVDGVSSGLCGSNQAWLHPFPTESPRRSLSTTLRLSGYSQGEDIHVSLVILTKHFSGCIRSKVQWNININGWCWGSDLHELITDWLTELQGAI